MPTGQDFFLSIRVNTGFFFKHQSKYWFTSIDKWKEMEKSEWCNSKNIDFGMRNTWSKAHFCDLWATWPWAIYLMSLSLSFLIYKMEKVVSSPQCCSGWFIFTSGLLRLLKTTSSPQNNGHKVPTDPMVPGAQYTLSNCWIKEWKICVHICVHSVYFPEGFGSHKTDVVGWMAALEREETKGSGMRQDVVCVYGKIPNSSKTSCLLWYFTRVRKCKQRALFGLWLLKAVRLFQVSGGL